MRTFSLPCLVFSGLWLAACGSDDPEPTPSSPSSPTPPEITADTAGPAPVTACLDLWSPGRTEVDPLGPDTQIHASSVFDGERVWMAWNRPDAGSQFDIWLAAFTCDGVMDAGPFEVTLSDDSELDPVLAVSGDRLLVAWSSDNGMAPSNLDIRYRIYGLDGTPVTSVEVLEAARGGVPVTGNATLPDAVGTDDGFLLAGSWGHDDSPAFQSFVVTLDPDGAVIGEATDGEVDAVNGQTQVDVAMGDGGPWLAWQEDSVDSTQPSLVGGPLGSPVAVATPGARPALAWGPGGMWMVYDTDLVGDVVVQAPDGRTTILGDAQPLHSAAIAAADDGVVVLAMELVAGIANRIRLWRLDASGQVVASHTLATETAVSVYGVDLTLIDGRHAVVAYQDGVNPAFRAHAEWVTFPE